MNSCLFMEPLASLQYVYAIYAVLGTSNTSHGPSSPEAECAGTKYGFDCGPDFALGGRKNTSTLSEATACCDDIVDTQGALHQRS